MASQLQSKARPEVEILQRVRRIETRLTDGLLRLGLREQVEKPSFAYGSMPGEPGRVTIPSIHCSLKEIIDSVPDDWHGPFGVFNGTEQVAVVIGRGADRT
jgi:hypothetical protein